MKPADSYLLKPHEAIALLTVYNGNCLSGAEVGRKLTPGKRYPASIYNVLRRLATIGMLDQLPDGCQRKLYKLTDSGITTLAERVVPIEETNGVNNFLALSVDEAKALASPKKSKKVNRQEPAKAYSAEQVAGNLKPEINALFEAVADRMHQPTDKILEEIPSLLTPNNRHMIFGPEEDQSQVIVI